jgi:hypothetical protein
MSNDSFTEVTRQSWFGRIGDSIKGVLFGLLFLAIGVVVLFWNEGRAVHRAQDLSEGASAAVSVKSDAVDPANNGKLIHFSATTATPQHLADATFSVSPSDNVLKLRRTVEMYQWKEKKTTHKEKNVGGSETTKTTYSYEKVWDNRLIDSSSYKMAGHSNPGAMPLPSEDFVASPITAGAFQLTGEVIAEINHFEPLPVAAASPTTAPSTSSAAASLPEGVKPFSGGYYKGSDPGNPQIGDAKISFSVVKPGPISVIAKQVDGRPTNYLTRNGNKLLEVRAGTLSAPEMFKLAEKENTMWTWIFRLVGYVVVTIGLGAILRPLVVIADILPIMGDLLGMGAFLCSAVMGAVLSVVVIGVGWLFYRPVLGVGLFVVAGLAMFALKRAGKARKAAAR